MDLTEEDATNTRIEHLKSLQRHSGWSIYQEHMLALAEQWEQMVLNSLDGKHAGMAIAYAHCAIWPMREIVRLQNALQDRDNSASVEALIRKYEDAD